MTGQDHHKARRPQENPKKRTKTKTRHHNQQVKTITSQDSHKEKQDEKSARQVKTIGSQDIHKAKQDEKSKARKDYHKSR